MGTFKGIAGSINFSEGLLKTSSAFFPSAYFKFFEYPHNGSSPYLPGKILKVSPIHTSAILQSTKELKVILGAGISLNFGVVVLLSMEIEGATKKPIIKLNQEKINKNCIFIDI
jgi:hypothetical protein